MNSRSFMVNTRRSGTLDRNPRLNPDKTDSSFDLENLDFHSRTSAKHRSKNRREAKAKQKRDILAEDFNDDDDIVEIDLETNITSKKVTQSFMVPKKFLDENCEDFSYARNTQESFRHENTNKKKHHSKNYLKSLRDEDLEVKWPAPVENENIYNPGLEHFKEDSEISKLNYYNLKHEKPMNRSECDPSEKFNQSQNFKDEYEFKDFLEEEREGANKQEKAANIYPQLENTQLDSTTRNDMNSTYFKQLLFDPTYFVQKPPPENITVRCKIVVMKGIFNEYFFYLEDTYNDYLLLKTVRKKTIKQIAYDINIANTLSSYKIGSLNSDFGRSNFLITGEFDEKNKCSEKKYIDVEFTTKYIGSMKPKDLFAEIVLFDKSKPDKETKENSQDSLGIMFHRNSKSSMTVTTKKPFFDPLTKTYRLKFQGRVKVSSSNNIQLVNESEPDEILFQLGKLKTKCYSCDFRYPFCALSAFGMALTCLSRT